MHPTKHSSRLNARTLRLVHAYLKTATAISLSDATGLPIAWLTAYARGEIPHPNVHRVECLWEYLKGKKLQVD